MSSNESIVAPKKKVVTSSEAYPLSAVQLVSKEKTKLAKIALPDEYLSPSSLLLSKEKKKFERLAEHLEFDDTPKLDPVYEQDHIIQILFSQWHHITVQFPIIVKETQSLINKFHRNEHRSKYELCIVHYQVANKHLSELIVQKKNLLTQLVSRLDVLKRLESNDEIELKKAYQQSRLRFNRCIESLAFTFVSLGHFLTPQNIKIFKPDLQEIIESIIPLLQTPNLELDKTLISMLHSLLLSHIGLKKNWLGGISNIEPIPLDEIELRHHLESLSPAPELKCNSIENYKQKIITLESSIVQMPTVRLQRINDILTAETARLHLENQANQISQEITATVKGFRSQIQSLSTKVIGYKSDVYNLKYLLNELENFEKLIIRITRQHNDSESGFSELIKNTKKQSNLYEKHELLVQHCELRKIKLDLLNQELTTAYEKYKYTLSSLESCYSREVRHFQEKLKQAFKEMKSAQKSTNLVPPIAYQEIDALITRLGAIINRTIEAQPNLPELHKRFEAYNQIMEMQINTIRNKLKSAFELNIDLIDSSYLFNEIPEKYNDLDSFFTRFDQLAKSSPTSFDFELSHELYLSQLSSQNPYREELDSKLNDLKEKYLTAKKHAFEIDNLTGDKFSLWQSNTKPLIKNVDSARRQIFNSASKVIIAEKKIKSSSFQTSLEIIDNIDQEIARLLSKYLPQKQNFWQNKLDKKQDCEQTTLMHELFSELTVENTLETINLIVKEPPIFFFVDLQEENPLKEKYQNLFQGLISQQRKEKILDTIDPRLKRLITLKSEFSQLNTVYLAHDNHWTETDYHKSLVNKVQNHLNNDHMEDLSDERRLRFTQWIRSHVYKPLQKGFQNISLFFSPLPENQQKPCFVTWQATKTEREMVTLGNDMISNLNAAAPAA